MHMLWPQEGLLLQTLPAHKPSRGFPYLVAAGVIHQLMAAGM